MKKFITGLSLLLAGVLLAGPAAADDGITASGDVWTLYGDGTLEITDVLYSEMERWDAYSAQVRRVVLNAKSVGHVWNGMFADCTALEEIVLSGDCGNYSVRDGVLFGSGGELRCYPAAKTETEYVIPEDCTLICDQAFAGAKNLTKVTIPDGLVYIGDYAFEACTALTEAAAADGTFDLFFPEHAFEGCTSLDPSFIEAFCWDESFHDVTPQTDYYEGIRYACLNGLMNGTSKEFFSPDTGMTRAMFVTVLGRMAGVTDVKKVTKDGVTYTEWNLNGQWGGIAEAQTFTDAEDGRWYTDYVHWAAAQGILRGYGDGTFGVNDPVTIEQAAVILERHEGLAEEPLYELEEDFSDADHVSGWAETAMRWAVMTGIYEGYGDELRPAQEAPRALVAQMLCNYSETDADSPVITGMENPDWGLTLTASKVTSTGMTLTFMQSGGNPTGTELISGWYYFLEVFDGGEWVRYPSEVEVSAWVDEGWIIPLGGEFTIDVSWKPQYGELPAGQYRMGKRVNDFRGPGDYDHATFYAEFTVE